MDLDRKELLQNISQNLMTVCDGRSISSTKLKNVSVAFSQEKTFGIHTTYKPCVCIISQGRKSVAIGENAYSYGAGEMLLSCVKTPVSGNVIKASKSTPYICTIIDLNPAVILDILKSEKFSFTKEEKELSSIAVSTVTKEILDALLRLSIQLKNDQDSIFLASLNYNELIFQLLNSNIGKNIAELYKQDSHIMQISNVIEKMQNELDRSISISELSKFVGMSESVFHRKFKLVTNTTPIQFQKKLRLQQARHLMFVESLDVTSAALKVGYNSLSQFSREYTKLFGQPPTKDIKALTVKKQF